MDGILTASMDYEAKFVLHGLSQDEIDDVVVQRVQGMSEAQQDSPLVPSLQPGCEEIRFLSNAYETRSSSAPYYTYAAGYAYSEMNGSGCDADLISIKLREDNGPYTPTRDSASNWAYPNGPREYASVDYRCNGPNEYFTTGNMNPYSTASQSMC